MKSKIIFAVLILLVVSCGQQQKEAPGAIPAGTATAKDSNMVELSAAQVKNAGIAIGIPGKRSMHTVLKVNGVADVPPQNMVSVSIPLGGYLKKTALIPGAKVTKGAVLATLEDQQYIALQQDFLTAKSRLEYTSADFERQKKLNESKSVSDKVYQQAKADFEENKILVKSLSEKLWLININPETLNEGSISRSINVYSPINGYVTNVNVNTGKYVKPEDVLFELINPNDLHIRLTVFEDDASRLVPGQKIVYSTNNQPEHIYTATIHFITPNIGNNRATEVHCHPDGDSKLFPGTFINATIELNKAEVLAVPEEAIVKWDNKLYVFSQETDRKFKLVPVETGAASNGYIEIKSTLPEKNIVIKNAYTILMTMKNSGEEG